MTSRQPDAAPPARSARREPAVITSELPAEPASVATARHAIVEFARSHGANADDIERIALAVTEAATNVVLHAYPTGIIGPLRYLVDVEDGELQVIVADAGAGLRGSAHRRPGLGMGLTLIAGVTSSFALSTLDGGFEVWMGFVLGAAGDD